MKVMLPVKVFFSQKKNQVISFQDMFGWIARLCKIIQRLQSIFVLSVRSKWYSHWYCVKCAELESTILGVKMLSSKYMLICLCLHEFVVLIINFTHSCHPRSRMLPYMYVYPISLDSPEIQCSYGW